MRIASLRIENFKALRLFELSSLSDMVVLAGPNGAGKTCVLDAIRLLKSAYGGYIPTETQNWLNEFNLTSKPGQIDVIPLLHDRASPLRIAATFTLSPEEREYLTGDIAEVVRELAISQRSDMPFEQYRMLSIAAHVRLNEDVLRDASKAIQSEIVSELNAPAIAAEVTNEPNGKPQLRPSRLLELLFSTYRPAELGVLEFHSAHRVFAREATNSIQLSVDQTEQNARQHARQHALYNTNARYTGLKQQLASAYVKRLIANAAGTPDCEYAHGLKETLDELFETFMPGKRFVGPEPSKKGTLRFDVLTPSGVTHDINDLSAGEKEVLYGYLLLRNRGLRNSILMIDEPEIHLNPRLISGLPAFYLKHLGSAFKNQLWMVTHSDAIVREAVETHNVSVVHIQPAGLKSDNQAKPVSGDASLRSLLKELVGDFAAFRPAAPIVIFEGGGKSEFDIAMTARLFPRFSASVNAVAGHNKSNVRKAHLLLGAARASGAIEAEVFSIVDQDDPETNHQSEVVGAYVWDRYHIENYLLCERFILESLQDLHAGRSPLKSTQDVYEALHGSARKVIDSVVVSRLRDRVRTQLVGAINIGCPPQAPHPSKELQESIRGSSDRIATALKHLDEDTLWEQESALRTELLRSLGTGEWRSRLPGRDILRDFSAQFATPEGAGAGYTVLRNLILSKMVAAGYQPSGMRSILSRIGVPT